MAKIGEAICSPYVFPFRFVKFPFVVQLPFILIAKSGSAKFIY